VGNLLLVLLYALPATLRADAANTARVAVTNVAEFNGSYRGSYLGTAQFNEGPVLSVDGLVAFSISDGNITVTSPGSGSGTVDSAGTAAFTGSASGDGASYNFIGTLTVSSTTGMSASGSWTATIPGGTASGSWTAVLNGLVGNVSTRLPVGTDDNVLIEGFIVQGPSGSIKKIIVRATGPSLAPFGISDPLANPTLEIKNESDATIARNNDWKNTQVGGLITGDQSAEINASQLAPGHDLESAIIANLAPGNYTAVVRGVGNTTGTGVVDAYDLSPTSSARLANIATRGLIQPGDKLMIGGFIIQKGPARAVIRAIGPSLTGFGISNALPDTTLQLRNGNGAIVRENDNWKSDPDQKQALEGTGLQPAHDLEAALIETIQPGQYTAQVRGQGNASGIGVVQVYFLQ
jgi:hypothetical protein